jgi:hypothetical protein
MDQKMSWQFVTVLIGMPFSILAGSALFVWASSNRGRETRDIEPRHHTRATRATREDVR